MKKKSLGTQYIIRRVPTRVDRLLRQRSKEVGKSLNQVSLEALIQGVLPGAAPFRDLSAIAGSFSDEEADALDAAIREQRQIDLKAWK